MEHWHGMQWTMPPAQAPTCPTCATTSAHGTRTARDPSALHSCTFYLVDAKHQAPCQTSASAVSLAASMLDVHSNYSANKCCFALLIPDAGNLFWLCVSSGQRNVHTYIHRYRATHVSDIAAMSWCSLRLHATHIAKHLSLATTAVQLDCIARQTDKQICERLIRRSKTVGIDVVHQLMTQPFK